MKKFQFSEKVPVDKKFYGHLFYNAYKDSEFLRDSKNIETILSKGYQLRNMLKSVAPGETVALEGMWIRSKCVVTSTPLLVRKAGPNIDIESYEFTANRLSGLTAAYAFDNRHQFPEITSSEAETLGLTWDNQNTDKSRLYLSAVTGTEHFWEQFSFFPLICGLRKLQLQKITPELVVKMAKIKNKDGIPMGKSLMKNLKQIGDLWEYFPGSTTVEFVTMCRDLPAELKVILSIK